MPDGTILLVEDNADDEALTLGAFRENHVVNNVVVARDGAEALDYVFGAGRYQGRHVSDLPHVVLLNLHLPKVDGLEVLRRIRADERTRRLPVVLFSWSHEKDDMARAYELGANGYIHKPFDSITLRWRQSSSDSLGSCSEKCPGTHKRQIIPERG